MEVRLPSFLSGFDATCILWAVKHRLILLVSPGTCGSMAHPLFSWPSFFVSFTGFFRQSTLFGYTHNTEYVEVVGCNCLHNFVASQRYAR